MARDVIPDSTRIQAQRLVGRVLARAAQAPADPSGLDRCQAAIRRTVAEIVDALLANRNLVVDLMDIRTADNYTCAHCVNVCVLAIMTGMTLGMHRSNLLDLGVSAMLHDLGKVRLPERVLKKRGALSPEEYSEIKKHAVYGYDILRAQGMVTPLTAVVAYQHHERYNGEGYPRGLQRDEIHPFAQVVAVADVYDALVADRVYRPPFLPHEAAEMVSGAQNFCFDHRVAAAFLSNVAVYPVGTAVRLNTGQVGLVAAVRRGLTLRPRVRLILDADGRRLRPPSDLELVRYASVMVAEVLEEDGLERALAAAGVSP
ncbi:MAG: HD-GYP domain-containing protein [Acetobacteraceae bacterium]|nr:HD-GYP domain-containing protein [Acetobacteraceae bacterium]